MAEPGCVHDAHFNNLEVSGKTILKDTSLTGFVSATATQSLSASDSGKIIAVGPAGGGLAADSVFTLPPVENGLFFSFKYFGGATDAEDFTVQTSPNNVNLIGGVSHLKTDGTAVTSVYTIDGDNNDKLIVLTPQAGTWIDVICNGTNWHISGQVISVAANAPSFDNTA